jgi:hypothetical protein
MNIGTIKSYYKKDPFTANNTLVHKLLGIIEHNEFKSITESTFRLALEEDGKQETEIQSILKSVIECKMYTRDQVAPFRSIVKKMCYQSVLADCKYDSGDDPEAFIEGIKNYEYKSNYDDVMVIKSFGDIDITDIYKDMISGKIESRYKTINQSYPLKAFPLNQLIMVVGAPGTGKSFYLMSEAEHFIKAGKRLR